MNTCPRCGDRLAHMSDGCDECVRCGWSAYPLDVPEDPALATEPECCS